MHRAVRRCSSNEGYAARMSCGKLVARVRIFDQDAVSVALAVEPVHEKWCHVVKTDNRGGG